MSHSYFSEDDINAPAWDTGLVKRIWPYITNWRIHFLLAIFLVLLGTAVRISLPWILGQAVDHGIKSGDHNQLIRYSLYYLLGQAVLFLLSAARNWILQYTGQKVLHDLRNHVFKCIQKLPLSFFDKTPVGRLVTRLTNDVATLSELFSAALINVSGEFCLLIGIAGMMLALNPKLGVASLLTAPILIAVAWFLKVRMRDAFRVAREKLATVNASLAENVSGMSVIQTFNQEPSRETKFNQINTDLKKAELDSVFYHSFFVPAVTVVNALTLAIVTVYGGYLVSNGEISIGLLIAFIAYSRDFFQPVRQISEKVGIFQSAMASAERVFTLIDQQAEPDINEGKEFVDLKDKLEFRHLSFAYSPDKPVLRDLSFSIKKGERVAVVGHTGAGKTTLASLLKRFYEFTEGDILLDGISIKDFSRASLRRKIALIQQDVNIFSGTVMDNIFLEEKAYDQQKLDAIIKELEMEKFISELDQGVETPIKERGSNLSAGQRQLIAFSRALATEPSILILDEATSSVDSETEQIIQQAVLRLTQNRTSLVIAHRLSTIKHCDRILVFHNGQLVEQGSHEELLQKGGYYHKLYEVQFADGNSQNEGNSR